MMSLNAHTGWVTDDGSYGACAVITFDENDLTAQQWDTLSILADNDRLPYVQAIMAGMPLDQWEQN